MGLITNAEAQARIEYKQLTANARYFAMSLLEGGTQRPQSDAEFQQVVHAAFAMSDLFQKRCIVEWRRIRTDCKAPPAAQPPDGVPVKTEAEHPPISGDLTGTRPPESLVLKSLRRYAAENGERLRDTATRWSARNAVKAEEMYDIRDGLIALLDLIEGK